MYSTSGISINNFSISLVTTSDLCMEAAFGNCTFTKKYPISSSGIKPAGTILPKIPAPTDIITIKTIPLLIFLETILV